MISPAVLLLLGWMLIPLGLTVYFSLLRYNLLMPGMEQWTGLTNYRFFLTDPAFFDALRNTLVLVVGVLAITVIGGVLLALLLDQPFWGRGIVRVLVIAPFFIMPTVSALVWEEHVHESGLGPLPRMPPRRSGSSHSTSWRTRRSSRSS